MGGYSAYLRERSERRRRWQRRHDEQQAELERLRARIAREYRPVHTTRELPAENRKAAKFYSDRQADLTQRRLAQARRELARLESEQVRKPPRELVFHGLDAAAGPGAANASALVGAGSGEVLISANEVEIPGRLAPVSLTLREHDRLLVEGANGAGKSTLLDVLAGRLAISAGTVERRRGLRCGVLRQSPEVQDARLGAADAYRRAVGARRAEETPLSTFGLIAGRDQNRCVGELSTGQRRRLDLAIVLADPPEVLLLDEPTNHLSLLLVDEIEESLGVFPGAVVIASHDRWLRRRWQWPRLELHGVG